VIDTAGALLGVEEESYIQHHQVSSYGAVVVQSRVLGSLVLYVARRVWVVVLGIVGIAGRLLLMDGNRGIR